MRVTDSSSSSAASRDGSSESPAKAASEVFGVAVPPLLRTVFNAIRPHAAACEARERSANEEAKFWEGQEEDCEMIWLHRLSLIACILSGIAFALSIVGGIIQWFELQ